MRKSQKLSATGLKSLAFNVHGVTTRVMTNSNVLHRAVANFLKHFAVNEPSSQPDIDVSLLVVDSLTDEMASVPKGAEALYDWGTIKIFRDGPRRFLKMDERARVLADLEKKQAVGYLRADLPESDWLIAHMIFYPLWAQLIKESGLFPFHGAGLIKDGKGILLPGRSGSGKSTLSLRLVANGYGLLSDDTVFLRLEKSGAEALCFPEEINVTAHTIELLPELSRVKSFRAHDYLQKSSFPLEELYPGAVAEKCVPAALIFPEIADAKETTVKSISSTEALELSMRYGYFFLDPSTAPRHLEVLSRLARQASCFRIYCGRNQKDLRQALAGLLSEALKPSGEEKLD